MHGLIRENGGIYGDFFDGLLHGQLRAVRLHKIIQTVADADVLDVLIRVNITKRWHIYGVCLDLSGTAICKVRRSMRLTLQ
jgi:hypothetical protein